MRKAALLLIAAAVVVPVEHHRRVEEVKLEKAVMLKIRAAAQSQEIPAVRAEAPAASTDPDEKIHTRDYDAEVKRIFDSLY